MTRKANQAELDAAVRGSGSNYPQVPYDQAKADRDAYRVRVTRNGVGVDLGPSGHAGGSYGGGSTHG